MIESNSLSKACRLIESNQCVFVHGGAATPHPLLREIVARHDDLKNLEFIHLHTEVFYDYAQPKYSNFKVSNLFVSAGMRPWLDYDRVDYLPCFISEIPQLFKSGRKKIDVALVHVSSPDQHGNCSLGVSVDVAKSALDHAQKIIAIINPQMPRTHGDGIVHLNQIAASVEMSIPIYEPKAPLTTDVDLKIADYVGGLIEDGDTIQVGIGSVPDAIVRKLSAYKNLGLHTEMFSDGVLQLIKSGVINNSQKKFHAGKSVTSFLMGSRDLYDYVDDNPEVLLLSSDYVNNPINIARNKSVVTINSAVEIDLTGQICADSVGNRIISGVGGQMDFMVGASLAEKSKSIIAIHSRASNGKSRIVPNLKPGAGVVTTRGNVRFVATEYGCVDLFGKSLSQRAKALASIAHPEDRDFLLKEWKSLHHGI